MVSSFFLLPCTGRLSRWSGDGRKQRGEVEEWFAYCPCFLPPPVNTNKSTKYFASRRVPNFTIATTRLARLKSHLPRSTSSHRQHFIAPTTVETDLSSSNSVHTQPSRLHSLRPKPPFSHLRNCFFTIAKTPLHLRLSAPPSPQQCVLGHSSKPSWDGLSLRC